MNVREEGFIRGRNRISYHNEYIVLKHAREYGIQIVTEFFLEEIRNDADLVWLLVRDNIASWGDDVCIK